MEIELPFIQVAGVIDQAEADLLVRCGVPYVGFPLRLPVHRDDLTESEAAQIIASLPPTCRGVLITYLDRASEICTFCDELGVSIVQLHGDIECTELEQLHRERPDLTVIKSLVIGRHSVPALDKMIDEAVSFVDAFITDTFDPSTGASGATGQTHDWQISRALVAHSPRPVILAGGLHPGNVREAIATVGPAGVDAHTGLEDSSGRKVEQLVRQFVAEATRAFRR